MSFCQEEKSKEVKQTTSEAKEVQNTSEAKECLNTSEAREFPNTSEADLTTDFSEDRQRTPCQVQTGQELSQTGKEFEDSENSKDSKDLFRDLNHLTHSAVVKEKRLATNVKMYLMVPQKMVMENQ